MKLSDPYDDNGRTWRNIIGWEPGDVLPPGYQYQFHQSVWSSGGTAQPNCIMVGVPYRIPVVKPGPSWDDVRPVARSLDCQIWSDTTSSHSLTGHYISISDPALALIALNAIAAKEKPADPPQPEAPAMSLGPAYKDGGKWWQDVLNPDLSARKPSGTQYQAPPGDWYDVSIDGSLFYKNHDYRIPATQPHAATEAPALKAVALPMTLVPTSPQPPCGSVVLVGRYQQAYQRSVMGWQPAGGTVAHSWHRLLRDNDPVILIYVPPEPSL